MSTAKRGNFAIGAGIMGIFFISMALGSIQPAMAKMYEVWPNISKVAIGYMISLPAGTVIIGSLVVGALLSAKKIGYKTTAILGSLLFILGGVAPTFIHNFWVALIGRGVVGFSLGFLSALGNPLISAFFDGGRRAKLLSLSIFFAYGGQCVMQLFAGVLCDMNFWYTFLTNFIAVIGLIAILVGLKEPTDDELPVVEKTEKGKLPGRVVAMGCILAVCSLCIFPALFGYSVICAKFTDKVTTAAMVQIVFSIANMIGGLAFAITFAKFRRQTINIFLLVCAVGLFVVARSGSVFMLSVGMALVGFADCVIIPAVLYVVGVSCKPAMVAFGTAVVMSLMNVTGFLASPYIALIGKITGDSLYAPIYTGAVLFVIVAIICFVKNPFPQEQE